LDHPRDDGGKSLTFIDGFDGVTAVGALDEEGRDDDGESNSEVAVRCEGSESFVRQEGLGALGEGDAGDGGEDGRTVGDEVVGGDDGEDGEVDHAEGPPEFGGCFVTRRGNSVAHNVFWRYVIFFFFRF